MSEKPDSYEAAVERLEEIIDRLDSGQAGLRETLDLCREGRELVNYCAAELDAVGEGLKELRLDELAAKLVSLDRPSEVGPRTVLRIRCQRRARADQAGSRGRGPSRAAPAGRQGTRRRRCGRSPLPGARGPASISAAPSMVSAGSSGRSRKT